MRTLKSEGNPKVETRTRAARPGFSCFVFRVFGFTPEGLP